MGPFLWPEARKVWVQAVRGLRGRSEAQGVTKGAMTPVDVEAGFGFGAGE